MRMALVKLRFQISKKVASFFEIFALHSFLKRLLICVGLLSTFFLVVYVNRIEQSFSDKMSKLEVSDFVISFWKMIHDSSIHDTIKILPRNRSWF